DQPGPTSGRRASGWPTGGVAVGLSSMRMPIARDRPEARAPKNRAWQPRMPICGLQNDKVHLTRRWLRAAAPASMIGAGRHWSMVLRSHEFLAAVRAEVVPSL